MIDCKLIGRRVQKARTDLGLTQEVLAEAVGVSTNYMSKVETGREKPNLELLAKLSTATRVPMTVLLTDVVEEGETYLRKDMAALLKKCSPAKRKLIYEIAERVAASEV